MTYRFMLKTAAVFIAVISIFTLLFSGCSGHMIKNRVFLNEYYTEEQNERQKYDLVFPKKAKGDLGLVLCIHGGGWVEGSKDSYTNNLYQVSEEKGIGAACINYRYASEEVNYSDILDDISSALAAIKAKGAEYGVNFDKVLLTGISAGGHLSLLYGYTRKDTAPIRPACIVELCGPADLEDPMFYSVEKRAGAFVGTEYFCKIIGYGLGTHITEDNYENAGEIMKKYSPINFVDENSIPTVIGHGDRDDIVPYEDSVALDKKLTENNVEHTFITFKDSSHGCEDKSAMSEIMKLFFKYIDTYLK